MYVINQCISISFMSYLGSHYILEVKVYKYKEKIDKEITSDYWKSYL